MANRASPSPPMSPSLNRKRKSFARKCERACCSIITFFPLGIVYSLTTWAVWVEGSIGLMSKSQSWTGLSTTFVGIILYALLNWSYTTAVFTDPGSPLNSKNAYSALPSEESHGHITSLTVNSSGEARFCKKCQVRKPDRAHHCSSCRRCVLKMDHHCPWLATCVGFRNYKPFILFLIYTCLFCFLCFVVAGTWVWTEILDESQFSDELMPVNCILLTVIAGIIGLVLSGFTGWHLYLVYSAQTTLESLERTRYLIPIRQSMQEQLEARKYVGQDGPTLGDQLREIHANALPGVTRPEEGEEYRSPAHSSLRRNYQEMERIRERERYEDYLDEQDSEKLPNAFDLGWRRNIRHVFGERPTLWWLPICNTTGDGWQWEVSPKWVEASDHLAREREARIQENAAFDSERSFQNSPVPEFRGSHSPHQALQPPPRRWQNTGPRGPTTVKSSQHVRDAEQDDESTMNQSRYSSRQHADSRPTDDWNDIPEDLLSPPRRDGATRSPRS